VFDGCGGDASKGDDIVIDATGVGDGAGAELVVAGYPVIRYKGGSKADDPEEWRNRRVQSYMCYRNAYRDGTITFDKGFIDPLDLDDFYAQHVSIETKNDSERIEDLETKKEMLARGIKSPDMADAGSMIYATQAPSLQGKGVTTGLGRLVENLNEEW